MDVGEDNYNLPGYFGKERYQIFRLETPAHNTLTINGQNHGVARLIIRLSGSDGSLRIVTCFTPGKPTNEFAPPSISPLTKWSGAQMK